MGHFEISAWIYLSISSFRDSKFSNKDQQEAYILSSEPDSRSNCLPLFYVGACKYNTCSIKLRMTPMDIFLVYKTGLCGLLSLVSLLALTVCKAE